MQADNPVLVVAEMSLEREDSLPLEPDMAVLSLASVLVPIPSILERADKAHSRVETMELPKDKKAMRPSHAHGA